MNSEIRDWFWRLDQIQASMEKHLAGVRFVFALDLKGRAHGTHEFGSFPFGKGLQFVSFNCWADEDQAAGKVTVDLSGPGLAFVLSFGFNHPLLLNDTSRTESEARADWCVWYYMKSDGASAVMPDLSEHATDILCRAHEVCASAPDSVRKQLGQLSSCETWPEVLLYLAMNRVHPLLNVWATVAPVQAILNNEGEETFDRHYDWFVVVEPADVLTATTYAFEALGRLARVEENQDTEAESWTSIESEKETCATGLTKPPAESADGGEDPDRRPKDSTGRPMQGARAAVVDEIDPGHESAEAGEAVVERADIIAQLEADTPPLDKDSDQWVKNKRAAQIEGVATATLKKYRAQGNSNEKKDLGRDPDGRVWRRVGTPGSHPLYLRSTLKSEQK